MHEHVCTQTNPPPLCLGKFHGGLTNNVLLNGTIILMMYVIIYIYIYVCMVYVPFTRHLQGGFLVVGEGSGLEFADVSLASKVRFGLALF